MLVSNQAQETKMIEMKKDFLELKFASQGLELDLERAKNETDRIKSEMKFKA